jgi:hypothetical protein
MRNSLSYQLATPTLLGAKDFILRESTNFRHAKWVKTQSK